MHNIIIPYRDCEPANHELIYVDNLSMQNNFYFLMQDEPTPETFDRVNFDPKNKATNDSKLLDLLKCDDPADSGHGTDPGPSPSHR